MIGRDPKARNRASQSEQIGPLLAGGCALAVQKRAWVKFAWRFQEVALVESDLHTWHQFWADHCQHRPVLLVFGCTKILGSTPSRPRRKHSAYDRLNHELALCRN
jgi:hypothetical protein